MNLRVHSHEGRFYVQVSARLVPYSTRLFVPMFPADDPIVDGIDERIVVKVRFRNRAFLVPFLLIESIDAEDMFGEASLTGVLQEEESRDILCNIRDILDWD